MLANATVAWFAYNDQILIEHPRFDCSLKTLIIQNSL
jgi:hypothetical protein